MSSDHVNWQIIPHFFSFEQLTHRRTILITPPHNVVRACLACPSADTRAHLTGTPPQLIEQNARSKRAPRAKRVSTSEPLARDLERRTNASNRDAPTQLCPC